MSKREAKKWGVANGQASPKRPLARNTLKRVATGLVKHVIEDGNPVIVTCNHGGDWFRGQPATDPLGTVTASRDARGVIMPYVARIGQTGGNGSYTNKATDPLTTAVTKAEHLIIAANAITLRNHNNGGSLGKPADTITSKGQHLGVVESKLVAPHIAKFRGDSTGTSAKDPLPTVTAGGGAQRPAGAAHALGVVGATLVQTGYGERKGQKPRTPGLKKPLGTAVAGGTKHGLVAAITVGAGGATGSARPRRVDLPGKAVMVNDRQAIVSALMMKFYSSGGQWSKCDEPMHTVPTKDRMAVVTASLIKHYGGVVGHKLSQPAGTVTAKDSQALGVAFLKRLGNCDITESAESLDAFIESLPAGFWNVWRFLRKYHGKNAPAPILFVDGQIYLIVDIGMRMLIPRELFRAQGFPDSYVIDQTAEGRALPLSTQVRMVGNSVSPPVIKAIIAANWPRRAPVKAAA